MKRVERHIVKGNDQLEDLCYRAKLLYNFVNYYKRKALFGEVQQFSEYDITGLLTEYDQKSYRSLPAQTSQQVIKFLFKSWKAYFKSLKDWKSNPEKYNGKPKPPGYKDTQAPVFFTSQQVKLKDGHIHFPQNTNLDPIKTKVDNIKQVRIVPHPTCHAIEVVYEREVEKSDVDPKNVLSIDLGLDNLATCVSNVGSRPFIANGKPVKSMNQYYNKKRARLMSYVDSRGRSNRIDRLNHKRHNKLMDYFHKVSRIIVDYCVDHEIGQIIIGRNKGWKQESNIGKPNNQNFVSVPHFRLVQMIEYKAEEVGIEVEEVEESHTSKCDALAKEDICHQDKYLGTRTCRGLFKSSTGVVINSDVNGAINIARKSNAVQDEQICSLLDRGVADTPVRVTPDKHKLVA